MRIWEAEVAANNVTCHIVVGVVAVVREHENSNIIMWI